MKRVCKTHGEHENWRYQQSKGHYLCRYCIQETKRQQRITANYSAILAAVGKEQADRYIEEASQKQVNVTGFIKGTRRTFVSDGSFTKNAIERIFLLNLASGFDRRNIGWFCFDCGIYHEHYGFFDVDRIVPGKDGGKYEEGNIQVLCPNCHKCKTLDIDEWEMELPANIKGPEHRKSDNKPIMPFLF